VLLINRRLETGSPAKAPGSARAVNLDEFRTLPSSKATGATQIGRLTNLRSLDVDTSWYVRYRSTGVVVLARIVRKQSTVGGVLDGVAGVD
jgi:hypothetical protein